MTEDPSTPDAPDRPYARTMARPPLQVDHCRSCQAEIYWLVNTSTGKLGPINADPDPKGNCLIDTATGAYTVQKAKDRGTTPDPLYLSHFVTCPQARTRWTAPGKKGQ